MRSNNKEGRYFLFDDIACWYLTPSIVRTDRGVEFMKEFRKLCE